MSLRPEETQQIAETLTDRAEHRQDITEELLQMSPQDRLAVARRMDEINAEQRKTNANLPDLEISTSRDVNGDGERLDGINIKTKWYQRDGQAYTPLDGQKLHENQH